MLTWIGGGQRLGLSPGPALRTSPYGSLTNFLQTRTGSSIILPCAVVVYPRGCTVGARRDVRERRPRIGVETPPVPDVSIGSVPHEAIRSSQLDMPVERRVTEWLRLGTSFRLHRAHVRPRSVPLPIPSRLPVHR